MKQSLAAVSVLLLAALTACGGADKSASDQAPSRKPARAAKSPAAAGVPARKHCTPKRDVIVWSKVPGLPDSAQRLGEYSIATCRTTFEDLPATSPTQDGYCTLAAWASDNPGYNTDATPAKRPKKVQVSVGPAC